MLWKKKRRLRGDSRCFYFIRITVTELILRGLRGIFYTTTRRPSSVQKLPRAQLFEREKKKVDRYARVRRLGGRNMKTRRRIIDVRSVFYVRVA